ncbi:response regulator [Bradyrhizobium sp. WYCCWR 12699]|uniref:adenylate/guanylate cyclase domain-containing protein n=1 Tax=Bradyrhizobium sp. WYCCWR 12699 TaxID=3064203 RepID=UPI0028A4085D|nr:adenylate/guanylate cyclase domain-containing protein [Bradyrhizobium sp. WYCCWR 12699]MDT4739916.1 adenylate/guanylate cyclase domain-containing protein [Bradyrhizobium sp. WYCCWR 12699]
MTGTILVVDDEPDLEEVILQHFHRQIDGGTLRFMFARDGVEALQLVEGTPGIEVVLLDINMPRLDGLSTLQALQRTDSGQSTIIVSAYGDMGNIRAAMNRGAFDFITKPIDLDDLELTIQRTLQHVCMLREIRSRQLEAERAQASLSRYFSPQLASRLAAGSENGGMDVHHREIAVLFTDISGFLSLVEKMAPSTLGDMLNEYMFGMTETIFAHDGTVAKIIGDAIQVLFNAPSDQTDYATRAISCAHALDHWAEEFRLRWKRKGVNFGATRIGVHAGPALVGNFGGNRFFDYTAHGDTMNTAARLEAANKVMGTRVCVSGELAGRADRFRGRPIGRLTLRGRSEPLQAYEPLSVADFDSDKTIDYLKAYAQLEADDPGAMPAFAALIARNCNDNLAGFHLRRLLNGAHGIDIRLE